MPYITAPQQPNGHVGRTYFNVSYHHGDGSNWIAVVEEVKPGETELSAAEYEAAWQSNYDFNVVYETKRQNDVSDWVAPSLEAFHADLARLAADPQVETITAELVEALIGPKA